MAQRKRGQGVSENSFVVGDKVIINPLYTSEDLKDRVFTVMKKARVNYVLDPVDGIGPGVRANPAMLQPAPQALLDKPIVSVAKLCVGDMVRVKAPSNIDPTTLFVVIANSTKLKIAKLGGDDGRYWTIPHTKLEKVSIDLPAAMASATVHGADVATNR
jgi:hypothetical protein